MHTILNIVPKDSNEEDGLFFYVYIEKLRTYLGISKEELIKIFPENISDYEPWAGASPAMCGNYKTLRDIQEFSDGLKPFK
jgi:hypothetical protein